MILRQEIPHCKATILQLKKKEKKMRYQAMKDMRET